MGNLISSQHGGMQHYQLLCLLLLICKGNAKKRTYLVETNGDTDARDYGIRIEAQYGECCDFPGCYECGEGLRCHPTGPVLLNGGICKRIEAKETTTRTTTISQTVINHVADRVVFGHDAQGRIVWSPGSKQANAVFPEKSDFGL